MYLKSMTMRGFKSFASATKLVLEPGITCVVGPNGSGKSNVVDALAWVMGEQGAKNLRGGKMDDVIFAGTTKRKPLGRAEVTLTIDNSDGAIPIEYTEVSISRTLFRTGGSEYAINGAPARLVDIQELLNDSGLGKEMHVIVGQGRLDEILHADPLERRGFIEEAAGVLKHRRRKDKALRKLTGLQTNLDRLSDLRAELGSQLGPLGRQARAAKRAAGVQAVLRDASARLLADDISRARARLDATPAPERAEERRADLVRLGEEISADLGRLEGTREELRALIGALEARDRRTAHLHTRAEATRRRAEDRISYLTTPVARDTSGETPESLRARAERTREEKDEAAASLDSRSAALVALQEKKDALTAEFAAAEEELSRTRARIALRLKERTSLVSARDVAEGSVRDLETRLADLATRSRTLRAELEPLHHRLETARAAAAASESGETELDARYENAKAALDTCTERLADREREHASLDNRISQAQARAEALELGTRRTAELDDLLALPVSGVQAAVGEFLEITPGFETAITAYLGELASAIAVDDLDAARDLLAHTGGDQLVDMLVAGAAGRPVPVVGESTAAVDAEASPGEHARAAGHTAGSEDARSGDARLDRGSEEDDLLAATEDLAAATRAARTLVTTAHTGLAAVLDTVLADVEICPDVEAALARLAADPALTCVTRDGEVLSATRVRRTTSQEGHRIAARQALAETTSLIEELESARTSAAEGIAELSREQTGARARLDQALAALHESDAAIMAAGQELDSAAGALDGHERTLARIAADEAELGAALDKARTELTDASAALETDETEVDEEPDTGERDRLRAELDLTGESLVEARIAERAARDRVAFLSERIEGLLRRARKEEEARETAARAAAARVARARVAEDVALGAERLAELLAAQAEVTRADAERLRSRLEATGTELAGLKERAEATATELAAVTDAEHRARLERERFVLKLEELERRATEELGLSPDHLVEQYGPHLPVPLSGDDEDAGTREVPYVRAEVEKMRAQAAKDLARIGKVNPLALEEYEALKERHDYLEKQINDVEESRKDLLELVDQVDAHVREVFAEAFADTEREFARIFTRLFPGGEGALTLTDPDDMLTTGVEVSARPAGKKVKRLSLLSGGERSLVAVAMLVAIFKARPSPFYVMDEVEAALDDVNLARLLTVFEELQESSQLIVITHHKKTMSIADALYGVTMHGDGVSQVISQRIHRDAPVV